MQNGTEKVKFRLERIWSPTASTVGLKLGDIGCSIFTTIGSNVVSILFFFEMILSTH